MIGFIPLDPPNTTKVGRYHLQELSKSFDIMVRYLLVSLIETRIFTTNMGFVR